ncbi:hypothetical protein [Halorubrum sp. ARQ200]|uniref:hypothetical protein n=1 Tax=Halorubrum sp. ARQ200 TaxID=1855872 RepID=UPI0010F60792|nr:hypothetical protein [Halorubrum sp. ARQ200]TKX45820.1 hypothetical protein EXE50_01070 [Halorubrum sp. ARQ200]
MTDNSDTTNDGGGGRTSMTLACIKGREETRERLRELGFSEEEIATMERHHGPVELARGVTDGLRWVRERDDDVTTIVGGES